MFILDIDVSGTLGGIRRLDGREVVVEDEKVCVTPELDGEWVEDKPDLHLLAARMNGFSSLCENFTDEFRWNASVLPDWDPTSFCRILGNRTIAILGDSTMRQSAVTLSSMVSFGGCDEQVIFRPADTLIFEKLGALNRGAYWTTIVKELRPDIAVVSAGAHIRDETNFTRVANTVMADIEKLRKEQPGIHVVWKTQNPAGGHPTRGPSMNEMLTGHPIEAARQRAKERNGFKLLVYNHHKFWTRDNTVLPQLQKRGIPFLDMRMLYNRVDAHPWQTGDTLHFCQPGPLRIFPTLLQRLIENHFEVSRCVKVM